MKPLQLSLLALAIAGSSAQAIASEELGNLFSGGKAIRGPQASGFILGRADLIEACRRNDFRIRMRWTPTGHRRNCWRTTPATAARSTPV